jgi:hypothetical protein
VGRKVRDCFEIILWVGESSRLDFVVPIAMEPVMTDSDLREFLTLTTAPTTVSVASKAKTKPNPRAAA